MTYFIENRDFGLDAAMGVLSGLESYNKFGHAPNGLQQTITDMWERANSTPTQQIWLAPTAARIHTLQSNSVNDTTGGTGTNEVKVSYLPDWNSKEVTELVIGNLNAGIAMQNAAVIINRMEAFAQASTTDVGVNAGIITATAATDGTVTALIGAGEGQTQQAIIGIPSIMEAYIYRWQVQINKAIGAATSASFDIRVNTRPHINTIAFTVKDNLAVQSTGRSSSEKYYGLKKKFTGPCIIKIQGTASADDVDANSDFDLILKDIR